MKSRPVLRLLVCGALILLSGAAAAEEEKKSSGPVLKGKLLDSCAPWDGPAFDIRLDGGLTLHVYDSFSPDTAGKAFTAYDSADQKESASIARCGGSYNGCMTYQGTIEIQEIQNDTVTGAVEMIRDGGPIRQNFKVTYDRTFHPVCG